MEQLNYGDDWDYAGTRLRDSLVRLGDGRPFYVHSVREDGTVSGSLAGSPFDTTASMDDLNLSPVPLGYVNKKRIVSYTSRSPTRHYKQGLTSYTLVAKGSPVSLTSRDLAKTIMGVYPSVESVMEDVLTEEKSAQAFSRHFCVKGRTNGNPLLMYKHKPVGVISWNSDACRANFSLDDDYKYLNEVLEEETSV
jgi:hypothetical protein